MCGSRQDHTSASAAETATAPELEVTTSRCCGGNVAAAPAAPAQDDLAECPVMPGSVVNRQQHRVTTLGLLQRALFAAVALSPWSPRPSATRDSIRSAACASPPSPNCDRARISIS